MNHDLCIDWIPWGTTSLNKTRNDLPIVIGKIRFSSSARTGRNKDATAERWNEEEGAKSFVERRCQMTKHTDHNLRRDKKSENPFNLKQSWWRHFWRSMVGNDRQSTPKIHFLINLLQCHVTTARAEGWGYKTFFLRLILASEGVVVHENDLK